MTEYHADVIMDRNAECARADQWFKAKHQPPQYAEYRGSDSALDAFRAARREWAERSGYDRFMKRVYSGTFRKFGFVRSEFGGWKWGGK